MRVIVTPDLMVTTYEMLCCTAPFKAWKLPPADEVTFSVLRTRAKTGDHSIENGRHHIRASQPKIKSLRTLIELMAHEMAHMKDAIDGTPATIEHGAHFHKLARMICNVHGFDPGAF